MFFCSSTRQWLEPVRKVTYTPALGPGTDTIGNLVSHGTVNFLAGFDRRLKAFIASSLKTHLGSLERKYITAKNAGDFGEASNLGLGTVCKVVDSVKTK